MVSILITHYNRPLALKKCIANLHSIDWKVPYEIVVSDDGSTNENIEHIKKEKIDTLVLSKSNQGLATNLNKGIKACQGEYLLYCQEDFLVSSNILYIIHDCFNILNTGRLDMIRLTANYKFSKLIKLTNEIYKIPKFSFKNFNINTFQYSDHPYIIKRGFFDEYGYFLEGTSGPYGETEYAIRILNSKAKIGITNKRYAIEQKGVNSIMNTQITVKKRSGPKQFWRFARAIRQHFEWFMYSKSNRKLLTYKNSRK